MINYLRLLRPHQWLKNIFCFAPIFFSGNLCEPKSIGAVLIIFCIFCFTASSVYCFNDIQDIEQDKIHPEKRSRPLASGSVKVSSAYFLSVLLVVSSFVICLITNVDNKYSVMIWIVIYLILNFLYCLYLKHIALLDVFVVAFGFVVRVMVGGLAISVHVSHWLYLMTFLLALFLAFAKRRDDSVVFENTGDKSRNNIIFYNTRFIDSAMAIISTIIVICYILYTISPEVLTRTSNEGGDSYLYFTSFFVLLGVLRYLQLTIVFQKSSSPTKALIKDRGIQFCVLGWFILFFILLYL